MCNKCLNIIARFIRSLMFALGSWLVLRSGLSVTTTAESIERVQHDWSKLTYTKMPDRVVDALRDLIAAKTATQATAWLFVVIARRLNRRSNRVELTLVDLMAASGLSRASILKHTAVLESAGLLAVDRSTLTPTKNGVNVYHLAGHALSALLSPIIEPQSNHFTPESTQQTPPVYSVDRTTTESLTKKQTQTRTAVVDPDPPQPDESAQGDIEVTPPKGDSIKADDPRVDALVAVGVELYKARELAARHDLARIQDVIDHSQSRIIQHPAAFVVRALNANWQWDKRQHKPKARAERTPDYARQEVVYGSVETAPPDDVPEATRDVEPVPEWARQAWSAALSQWRLQWKRDAYDRFLAGAQVVDVVGDSWVIAAPSPEARQLLETRLYRTVQRGLADVLGWQPEVVNLLFEGVTHVR